MDINYICGTVKIRVADPGRDYPGPDPAFKEKKSESKSDLTKITFTFFFLN